MPVQCHCTIAEPKQYLNQQPPKQAKIALSRVVSLGIASENVFLLENRFTRLASSLPCVCSIKTDRNGTLMSVAFVFKYYGTKSALLLTTSRNSSVTTKAVWLVRDNTPVSLTRSNRWQATRTIIILGHLQIKAHSSLRYL